MTVVIDGIVSAAIKGVVGSYVPDEDARHLVSKQRQMIETHLRAQGVATHMFETGSWSHGTAVSGYSDVDYFAVMPRSIDQSVRALSVLETTLAMLPDLTATQDRPTVRVDFADGTPALEIVPAMPHPTSGEYEIPDPSLDYGWVASAPKSHFDYVNRARDHNPFTKDLIRAIKIWRYQHHVPASSFYLEMRAARQVLRSATNEHLSTHLARFFTELVRDDFAPMNDPSTFAGPRINIAPGASGTDLRYVEAAVKLAGVQMVLARTVENDNHDLSLRTLDQLFNIA